MLRLNKMTDTTPIERTQLWSKIGINSDAGQIQERGGLYVQDPAQAETQAQNEDVEMLEMRAVQTSFGDNHQVHLEVHSQAFALVQANMMAQKKGMKVKQPVSQTTVELMQEHIKDHINDMKAIQTAPGLVPNDQMSLPNPPTLTPQAPPPVAPADANNNETGPQKTQSKTAPIAKARQTNVRGLTTKKTSSKVNNKLGAKNAKVKKARSLTGKSGRPAKPSSAG